MLCYYCNVMFISVIKWPNELIYSEYISGISDCLHQRLYPEDRVQVRVRRGREDGQLRHVHPLQVPGEELD